jgi:hypothetical protein
VVIGTIVVQYAFRDDQHVVDRCRIATRILSGVVVAPQPKRVGPPRVIGERRVDMRAALVVQRVDRHVGEGGGVVGIGGHQVALRCDMGAGQPAHSGTESRRQPLSGDPVVVLRCDVAELRAVGEIVQGGREHQLVVGAVVAGPGRRLQRVVEFVDRVLVPDAAQRAQQITDFVENTHAASVPEIGLYQFLTCCSARQHFVVEAWSR